MVSVFFAAKVVEKESLAKPHAVAVGSATARSFLPGVPLPAPRNSHLASLEVDP
jgi:hypothetical protein